MRFLRGSTQQDIVIGPVWNTTDGTFKADLAYNAAGIDCNLNKGGSAKTDVSLANSAGNEYFRADVNGYYLLTLSTTDSNTAGRLRVTLQATGYVMAPTDYTVLSGAVYDVLFGSTALSTLAGTAQTGDAYARLNTLIGTPVNTGGTATLAAILGDPANAALAARLTTIDGIVADILVDTGTTLDARLTLVRAILQNRIDTDPEAGVMTIYDDAGTSPLLTADIWSDTTGTTPFDGTGANRRDRLSTPS